MIFTAENILLIGSILLFVSIVVGKTGYRFGVPALLLFLLVGMLFGSDGLGLQFHNAKIAQFIGMVALSVILFSGGMDTKFKEIRPILSPGIVLSTVGVFLTALFTGLFIWYLSGMSWTNIHFPLITSLLLASTMSSTDSASVFAILRSQKMNLKHNLRPMLELESGSNDPMAYMLTIVLLAIGIYGMIVCSNYMKKLMCMNIMQVSIIFFFLTFGQKDGATIPVTMNNLFSADAYINPVPHALMLTAIVVSLGITGVGLALLMRIKDIYLPLIHI